MVLYINEETLQFAGGLKIIENNYGREELWVLTNRLQVRKFLLNKLIYIFARII
jgi:Major royal jelly protein